MTNRLVNKFEILEDNFTVKVLLNDNYHALVDLPDWEIIKKYYWNIHKIPTRPQMYIRTVIRNNGKQSCILMHRMITNAEKINNIIHKDSNNFNNKRNNLEVIDKIEYSRQKAKDRGFYGKSRDYTQPLSRNKTGYKGVSFKKDRKSAYIATVSYRGKRVKLGYYKNPVMAALAYDCALKIISTTCILNFPNLQTNPELFEVIKKKLERYD